MLNAKSTVELFPGNVVASILNLFLALCIPTKFALVWSLKKYE